MKTRAQTFGQPNLAFIIKYACFTIGSIGSTCIRWWHFHMRSDNYTSVSNGALSGNAQVCVSRVSPFSNTQKPSKLGCRNRTIGIHGRETSSHAFVRARASCTWSYQTSRDTSFCAILRRFNTRWAHERNARIIDRRIIARLVTTSGRGKCSTWRVYSSASLGTLGVV